MRKLEFRYVWKHEKSLCTGIYNLKDIANGVAVPPKTRVGNIMKCWELIATDQFTGRLDKNGNKIFEGDVTPYLECSKQGKINALVIFDSELSTFALKWFEHGEGMHDFLSDCEKWLEVIGNVHDPKYSTLAQQ